MAGIGVLVGVGTILGATLIIGRLRDIITTTTGITSHSDITTTAIVLNITTDTDILTSDRIKDQIEIMRPFIMADVVKVYWEILREQCITIAIRDDMCRVARSRMCV